MKGLVSNMNLRQKAKHYKQLADLYGTKTIQPQIVYNTPSIKTYRTSKTVPRDVLEYDNFKSMVEKDSLMVMVNDLLDVADFEWSTDNLEYDTAKCTCTLKVVGR